MRVRQITEEDNLEFSGLLNLRPVFAEEPPPLWIMLFAHQADLNEALTHAGPGLFTCPAPEVDETKAAIEQLVEATNNVHAAQAQRASRDAQLQEALQIHSCAPAPDGGWIIWS